MGCFNFLMPPCHEDGGRLYLSVCWFSINSDNYSFDNILKGVRNGKISDLMMVQGVIYCWTLV